MSKGGTPSPKWSNRSYSAALSALLVSLILCIIVQGVEPDVTRQMSRLGSTGECGVPQKQSAPTVRIPQSWLCMNRSQHAVASLASGTSLQAGCHMSETSHTVDWMLLTPLCHHITAQLTCTRACNRMPTRVHAQCSMAMRDQVNSACKAQG